MATSQNGIYVLQDVVPAQIAAAPVGIKIVEPTSDSGALFTAAQVTQMKSGGGQVYGYVSLGEAENYRSYFSTLPKAVLGPVNPDWPGDYQVAYWSSEWKTVMQQQIDQLISAGYDGAYFDVVSEYTTSWAKSHAPNGDAAGAMVTLVESLADYAHAKVPGFKISANVAGAEPLLANQSFVNTIDAALEEELFYQDNGSLQSTADINYNLGLLHNLTAQGKPVIAVEYISGASKIAVVQAKAAAAGIGSYVANPNLALSGVDTEGFATLPTPTPAPTPTPTPTPITKDTLVLNLSEDAWQGDAKFTIKVDGAKLGSAQAVTASHGLGQTQSFTFTDFFGPGPHTVAVTYTNDAHGSAAGADRNLYVNSISFNGHVFPENITMAMNGTVKFSVS
jgi:cysteinyl-tRNA synthetase, unknown class